MRSLAQYINEEKRQAENFSQLRLLQSVFVAGRGPRELLRFDRRLMREGSLLKVRSGRRQQRRVFLFNDLLVYGLDTAKGVEVRGEVALAGAVVERLPDTEKLRHGVALIVAGGKGYTWVADTAEEAAAWHNDMRLAIRSCQPGGVESAKLMEDVRSAKEQKVTLEEHFERVRHGMMMTKYNSRDGRAVERWVVLDDETGEVCWEAADAKSYVNGNVGSGWSYKQSSSHTLTPEDNTKDPMPIKGTSAQNHKQARPLWRMPWESSVVKLADVKALLHGTKSAAFLRGHSRPSCEWLCFTLVTADRTIDLAAPSVAALLDWYAARHIDRHAYSAGIPCANFVPACARVPLRPRHCRHFWSYFYRWQTAGTCRWRVCSRTQSSR